MGKEFPINIDSNNILIIVPHPDDEIFYLGIIKYCISIKKELHFIYLSKGMFFKKTRTKELLRSLKYFNIDKRFHNIENYSDGSFFYDRYEIEKSLKLMIDKHSIDTIIAPDLDGGHPDHDVCHLICKKLLGDYLINICLFVPMYKIRDKRIIVHNYDTKFIIHSYKIFMGLSLFKKRFRYLIIYKSQFFFLFFIYLFGGNHFLLNQKFRVVNKTYEIPINKTDSYKSVLFFANYFLDYRSPSLSEIISIMSCE